MPGNEKASLIGGERQALKEKEKATYVYRCSKVTLWNKKGFGSMSLKEEN